MSAKGFTPGPWIVDGRDISPANNLGLGICEISPVDSGGAKVWHHGVETCANARLIASAPELLEALEAATTQMRIAYECVEAGRYDEALLHLGSMPRQRMEAIAKAKGEQP